MTCVSLAHGIALPFSWLIVAIWQAALEQLVDNSLDVDNAHEQLSRAEKFVRLGFQVRDRDWSSQVCIVSDLSRKNKRHRMRNTLKKTLMSRRACWCWMPCSTCVVKMCIRVWFWNIAAVRMAMDVHLSPWRVRSCRFSSACWALAKVRAEVGMHLMPSPPGLTHSGGWIRHDRRGHLQRDAANFVLALQEAGLR